MAVYAGVDIGSVATKVVLLRDDEVIAHGLAPTGAGPKIAATQALATDLEAADLTCDDVTRICGTGYGRQRYAS